MMDCVLPSRNARNGYLSHLRRPRHHQARAI
jgi:queuine/archaeosine tRNA-ribosyltransferase